MKAQLSYKVIQVVTVTAFICPNSSKLMCDYIELGICHVCIFHTDLCRPIFLVWCENTDTHHFLTQLLVSFLYDMECWLVMCSKKY